MRYGEELKVWYTLRMSNTISLPQPAYKELINRLTKLEGMIQTLLEKIEKEPAEGSDEWWEWAHKKGLEDIEKGRYTSVSTKKELDAFFQSL